MTIVAQTPVNLIFDTDLGGDYDDVGAMAILHTLADKGEVNILGTIACNKSKYIASAINAINIYCKRPNIPVGVVHGRAVNITAWQKWDSLLVARYPHKIKSNAQAIEATALYRQILAKQPDHSVTICTVGFLTNLQNLLESKPDKFSPLNGLELVRRKVKVLVSMAGRFPEGSEYNIQCDPIAAQIVAEQWPTNIVFSGWEIGNAIYTGLPLVQNESIKNSPIKDVFAHAMPQAKSDANGRMSWDETAVLVAVRGIEPYYSVVEGRMNIREWGKNEWNKNGKGHFYLVEKMPVPQIEKLLNDLMMR
ncbi:MAG: nucleoside hydrolase [Runella sp.]